MKRIRKWLIIWLGVDAAQDIANLAHDNSMEIRKLANTQQQQLASLRKQIESIQAAINLSLDVGTLRGISRDDTVITVSLRSSNGEKDRVWICNLGSLNYDQIKHILEPLQALNNLVIDKPPYIRRDIFGYKI